VVIQRDRLHDGLQDSYFHFAVSAGDHRRQHPVQPPGGIVTAATCLAISGPADRLVHYRAARANFSLQPDGGTVLPHVASPQIRSVPGPSHIFPSLLAHSLRSKSSRLEEKREELLGLQDFTSDIIHSMRGGLVYH